MATLGAEFATLRHRATDYSPSRGAADIELRELENEIASHRDRPSSVLLKLTFAFSPNGRLLATGDDEKTIRIWDPRRRKTSM